MSTDPKIVFSVNRDDDAYAQPPINDAVIPVQLPIVNAVWSENPIKLEPQDYDTDDAPMSNYEHEDDMMMSHDEMVIKQEIIDLDDESCMYGEPEELDVEKDKEENKEEDKPIQSVAPVRRCEQRVGFDRGLEPDYIVGATQRNGNLMFLMTWKNSEDGAADLLDSSLVYKRCPQIAIKFFEERLTYA